MNQTHWKSLGDPNFLGGYDFAVGERKTLTIEKVKNMEAFNPGDKKKETVRACEFVEDVKPMILNATNSKTLANLYKSDFIEDWAGRQFVIHFDTTVKVGGKIVGGLRILPILPQINETPKCHDCKGNVIGVSNMSNQQMANYTQKKYGKPLCAECATKLAEKTKKVEDVLTDDVEVK